MNKREIKEYAAAHGMRAHYRGNNSEDEARGFRFTPVLLNNLKNLEINQTADLRTMTEDTPEVLKELARNPGLTFDIIKDGAREALTLTIERIAEANDMIAEFKKSSTYITENAKYEASTV